MTTRIKLRRDTETNWTYNNPILALGEPGFDTTNNKIKVGDGVNTWTSLSYVMGDFIELRNAAAPLDIWAGEWVNFVKTDYGSEVDEIDTGLSITRGNNQGIYNSALEQSYDDSNGDPDGRAVVGAGDA